MHKDQFLPQTGSYVVKVKSGQSHDLWQDFDTVRLQISVGQAYHEGDKMRAVMRWSLDRFGSVVLCVNDTLQRYNYMFEKEVLEPDAYEFVKREGDMWLDRNHELFANKENVRIVRWSEWLNDRDYLRTREQIEALYSVNDEFRQSIHANIAEIWSRREKNGGPVYSDMNKPRFLNFSRKYLLEEISVFSMMFERERAIDVYPGTTIFAATVFQGRHLPEAPSGLGKGHFCRIDFSHAPVRPECAVA